MLFEWLSRIEKRLQLFSMALQAVNIGVSKHRCEIVGFEVIKKYFCLIDEKEK